MNILTIITKKSAREILKERKFLKYFSLKTFEIGSMIEIIDGNKKSPAIILKVENVENIKQEIRKGNFEIKKLKLSKSGDFSEGKIIENFDISDIKKILKKPDTILRITNKNLKDFFPKPRKNTSKTRQNTVKHHSGTAEISDILSFEKIIKRKKTYNSEMQELVDEIRNYFNEKAMSGVGSFSYYIGFFKKIPLREVRQFFGEAKQTKKSTLDKKKLFWWKIGQYIRKS